SAGPLPDALVVSKDEQLIARNGSAKSAAKLVPDIVAGTRWLRERVTSEQRVDAIVIIGAAVPGIRAGPRGHDGHRTRNLAELDVVVARVDRELLQRIHGRDNWGAAAHDFGIIHAIQQLVVELSALAIGVHGKIAGPSRARNTLLPWSLHN